MARPSIGAWAVALVFVACGKTPPPPGGPGTSGDSTDPAVVDAVTTPFAMDEAWERAREGDDDELARLARLKGVPGLLAGLEATGPARAVAIRALGVAPGLGQVAALARMAEVGEEADATLALESIRTIAARPRTAEQVEDAAELREGCEILLRIAKSSNAARNRRRLALGALRMFADRGVVPTAELPADP